MDGRKILVLNDDAATADLLSEIANATDCQIVFATSKPEFESAFANNATCIVLALCLPDIDGFEAVRHLAEHDYKGPVILLSLAMIEMREIVEKYAKIRGLNIVGSFQRPVDAGLLEDCVTGATGTLKN